MDEDELRALAWLYKELRDLISSFPSSLGDFIRDTPKWFVLDEESDNSKVSQMIEVADRAAQKILKKK